MKKIYISFIALLLSIGAFAQVLPNSLLVCGSVSNLSPNAVNAVTMTVYSGGVAQTFTSVLSNGSQFCMPSVQIGLDSSGVANYFLSIAINNCQPITQSGVWSQSNSSIYIPIQDCGVNPTCNTTIGAMPILGTMLSTLTAACTGTPPFTYLWNNGAATQSISTSPSSNNYSVVVTDALGCTSFAAYSDSTFLPFCSAQIQLPSNNTSNDLTAIANGGSAPYTYVWSYNGINISTAISGSILNATQAGNYCVEITDATGCTSSNCVYYNPTTSTQQCDASFYALPDSMGGPSSVGGLVYFFSVANGVAPFNYIWTFSDGSTSSLANPSHVFTYGSNNNNWAALTITDATGCVSSYSQQISVQSQTPQCSAFFDSYSNYSATAIGEIQFQNLTSGLGANASYSWSFGDGTPLSTSENPAHTFSASGTYNVCLTVSNNGCVGTYCQATYVDLAWWSNFPFNSSNCNAAFLLAGNSVNNGVITIVDVSQGAGANYSWSFSNGSTSNSQTPFFTLNNSGSYLLCLTVSNPTINCVATFCDTITIDSVGNVFKSNVSNSNGVVGVNIIASPKLSTVTSIKNVESNNSIELMPNPINSNAVLTMKSEKSENVRIDLVDVTGKVVFTDNIINAAGSNTHTLDFSSISNGVYFLKTNGNASSDIIKLVVKH